MNVHTPGDGVDFGGPVSLPLRTGRMRAGTPMAVAHAGTSAITREFAATVALSPMLTAPIMLEWQEIRT